MKNTPFKADSRLIQLGWVHPRVIEALKGLTSDQLSTRRKSGKFVEGKHWMKDPMGTVMWNFENLDAWIEGVE
ncbi:hypothetical protein DRW07_05235 [Alteromonas sediminis]|uniref:Excisionase n=1 Tax=Alteromonas sediminis TaxID=2259342 RepID=A0A3N5YFH5_9ALTE|nr:excisionase family protein [Alteromonas sediminis]RPJ68795.1 hypothetical protein DRW07_05235 [Alteromonas sediminis]